MEPLIVSSHEFPFFSLCFRNIIKNHKYLLFYVPTSSCFTILFSFYSLFSFLFILWNIEEPLIYIREHTGKTSIASCLCRFEPFSLYAIKEVSKKPKHSLLTREFKTTLFVHGFSPIKFWRRCQGWERLDFTFLLTFLLYFWCANQIFSITEVHTWFFVVW